MRTLSDPLSLTQCVDQWRQAKQRVAFVPTMGDLHQGHLDLVAQAHRHADRVVVSVFVNPLQFGPSEDFERYPRNLDSDEHKLRAADADLLFAPDVDDVYPNGTDATPGFETGELGNILCGRSRPGHFDGVATVVGRLFDLVRPDCAVFGQKDFQQLLVIRQLAASRSDDIDIIAAPIKRESDGLAMSSRNRYLSTDHRLIAPVLHAKMSEAVSQINADPGAAGQILEKCSEDLVGVGFDVEYLELRRVADLASAVDGDKSLILLAAARLGETRLIDNLLFSL